MEYYKWIKAPEKVEDLPQETEILVFLERPLCGKRIHSAKLGRVGSIGTLFQWDAPKILFYMHAQYPHDEK